MRNQSNLIEKILELQNNLNSFISKDWKNERNILDWLIAIRDEHSELINSLKWKWWKNFNIEKFEELNKTTKELINKFSEQIYQEIKNDKDLYKTLSNLVTQIKERDKNLRTLKSYIKDTSIIENIRDGKLKELIKNFMFIYTASVIENIITQKIQNSEEIKNLKKEIENELFENGKENIKVELIDILHFITSLHLQISDLVEEGKDKEKFNNIPQYVLDKVIFNDKYIKSQSLTKKFEKGFIYHVGIRVLSKLFEDKSINDLISNPNLIILKNNFLHDLLSRILIIQQLILDLHNTIKDLNELYIQNKLTEELQKEFSDEIVSRILVIWKLYYELVLMFDLDIEKDIFENYIYKNILNILRQKYGYKKGTYKKEIEITEPLIEKIEKELGKNLISKEIITQLKSQCLNKICEDNELVNLIVETLKNKEILDINKQLNIIEQVIGIINS
jgi:hypothetical protein